MAYKHVIRANTKNLLDYNKFNPIWKTNGIISDSGYLSKPTSTFNTSLFYTVSGYSATLPDVSNLLQLKGTYTFSISSISIGDIYIMKYNADGTMNKQICFLTNNKKVETLTFDELTYVDIKIRREIAVIVTGLMVQEGSTPTPYTPYNYLSSIKRMIKVSDVCQLLDKSKYPATHTQLGCTFINNGDGSFTINGTIQNGGSWSNPLQQITQNLYGHKILLLTNSTSDIVRGEMKFTLQNGSSKWGTYNSIYTVIYDDYKYINIRIYMDNEDTGKTIDNATVKFQLFDLTEMFGAGHEPATVAEFRQRFPNDYYPYSPQCWLTSYKSAVICKTKNLFDYKTSAEKTQTNNGITLVLNADYFELSGQQQAGKYIELGQSGFNIPFEVGKTYVLSADTIVKSGGKVFMRARYTDEGSPLTEWETVSWNLFNGTIAKRFTPTRPGYFDKITFYNAGDTIPISGDYVIRIQLEQGSTATSYVPYQHL